MGGVDAYVCRHGDQNLPSTKVTENWTDLELALHTVTNSMSCPWKKLPVIFYSMYSTTIFLRWGDNFSDKSRGW